jgi:predicted DNA-binding antitoxin AbrB/MazE fold protein
MTAVKAIYEGGVFKPKEPVDLQDKSEVEVLLPDKPPQEEDDPTGWKAIDSLRGIIKGAPPDMAENHDFYLYGRPRR